MDHSIDVRMEEPYYLLYSNAIKYYCAVTLKWTLQPFYILLDMPLMTLYCICDSTARIKQKMYLDYQQQRQQRNVNFQMEAWQHQNYVHFYAPVVVHFLSALAILNFESLLSNQLRSLHYTFWYYSYSAHRAQHFLIAYPSAQNPPLSTPVLELVFLHWAHFIIGRSIRWCWDIFVFVAPRC